MTDTKLSDEQIERWLERIDDVLLPEARDFIRSVLDERAQLLKHVAATRRLRDALTEALDGVA